MANPKGKPAAILRMEGTYRADRHGKKKAHTGGVAMQRPKGLGPAARAHWDMVTKHRREWLALSDRASLLRLCQLWQASQDALAVYLETPNGRTRATFTDLHKEWAKMASRFGLTPADRAKVGELTPDGADEAEIDRLIG